MHMADALISPAVGGTMWAAAVGIIGYSAHKIKADLDDRKIPLMGVLGAFIFAAQMINFTIPGTGSSGHLGGGMILAILIGPHAALLTISSVLVVQSLFFADGGLLALGCNIVNLGFFPCFIAYPLIYKMIVGTRETPYRILFGSILAAIAGLQLGSLGVVVETVLSGVTELPLMAFALVMQPIHLAIGLVEGIVTAMVVASIWKARPEILGKTATDSPLGDLPLRNVLIGFLLFSVLTGGVLSWFASSHPDGLEWAISRISGTEELRAPEKGIHGSAANIQEKTALLPDYGYPSHGISETEEETSPIMDAGTTISGLVGGALTLIIAVLIGIVFKKRTS